MAKASMRKLSVDELARLGSHVNLTDRETHAAVVAKARAFAAELVRRLPQWLAAVENPVSAKALREIVGFDRLVYGCHDGDPDLAPARAYSLAESVQLGAAVASHGGGPVPECPGAGRDAPPSCGLPVARGHRLCVFCEATKARKT